MYRPMLHVQNIFDALNPLGTGVYGKLKQRCLHLQNRVVGLADPGDSIVVNMGCSPAFTEYMLRITGVKDVSVLHDQASDDLGEYYNAHSVFQELIHDSQWEVVLQQKPILAPYMKSSAVYQAARASGMFVSTREWSASVTDRVTQKMNDKAIFYQECSKLGLPVPRYWIVSKEELASTAIQLMDMAYKLIYIRPTRSGGGVGNITVERLNSRYLIYELYGHHGLSSHEFTEALESHIKTGFWSEFIITEMLDLQASPGTLFFADDDGVQLICHTYQILDSNRSFIGFMYPIENDMITRHFNLIEDSLHLLVEPGYRGYGNIDWMVTKDGNIFIAERNGRQTAVVAPLKIAYRISHCNTTGDTNTALPLAIFTSDMVNFDRPITFEEVYTRLENQGLLWEQNGHDEGVIITIPPTSRYGINSVGIMVIGYDITSTHELYNRTLRLLGEKKKEYLFDLGI